MTTVVYTGKEIYTDTKITMVGHHGVQFKNYQEMVEMGLEMMAEKDPIKATEERGKYERAMSRLPHFKDGDIHTEISGKTAPINGRQTFLGVPVDRVVVAGALTTMYNLLREDFDGADIRDAVATIEQSTIKNTMEYGVSDPVQLATVVCSIILAVLEDGTVWFYETGAEQWFNITGSPIVFGSGNVAICDKIAEENGISYDAAGNSLIATVNHQLEIGVSHEEVATSIIKRAMELDPYTGGNIVKVY